MKRIPKLLHQTYASANLPLRLSRFQRTWKQLHPEWEYKLWSDEDIRDFFSHHYAWFMPIFNNYPHPIMRVDAFRYFLLYHYGGFYADLDSECFNSLDSLIKESNDILLTEESSAHIQKEKAFRRGLSYIVSNAFMGSIPKHSFWSHVIDLLQKNKDAWDLLDATGPFMLTKAHISYRPRISLLPSHYFCSLADERLTSGRQKQDKISQPDDIYAVHHWFGSWWKHNKLQFLATRLIKAIVNRIASLLLPNYKIRSYLVTKEKGNDFRRVITYKKGSIVADQPWDLGDDCFEDRENLPLVSALLITKNRKKQTLMAIECFLAQTYAAKELVIIDEGERELEQSVRKMANPLISYHRNENRSNLGQLRNQAIKIAKGEYVCQWDDDDLYHPNKISYQLAICEQKKADACFLLRELLLDQPRMSLAISDYRLWEGTILARKDKMVAYPAWRKGEDYWVVHRLAQKGTVVALDWPELYLYIYHGSNTWDKQHFAEVWGKATRLYFLNNEEKLKELARPYPHINQLTKL